MKKLFTSKTGFFSILLSLLGITACSGGEMWLEYGCPNADYDFKGKVTDETGNPISNIRVVRGQTGEASDGASHFYAIDSTQSRNDGTFEIVSHGCFPGDTYQFVFKDIDGGLNGGEFKEKTTAVSTSGASYKGGDSWYYGSAEITVPDTKLTKKD